MLAESIDRAPPILAEQRPAALPPALRRGLFLAALAALVAAPRRAASPQAAKPVADQ